MKHAKLEDLLPPEGLAEIQRLINAGRIRASDFKVVTHRHRDYLAERHCDPDYIAYVLEYLLGLEPGIN